MKSSKIAITILVLVALYILGSMIWSLFGTIFTNQLADIPEYVVEYPNYAKFETAEESIINDVVQRSYHFAIPGSQIFDSYAFYANYFEVNGWEFLRNGHEEDQWLESHAPYVMAATDGERVISIYWLDGYQDGKLDLLFYDNPVVVDSTAPADYERGTLSVLPVVESAELKNVYAEFLVSNARTLYYEYEINTSIDEAKDAFKVALQDKQWRLAKFDPEPVEEFADQFKYTTAIRHETPSSPTDPLILTFERVGDNTTRVVVTLLPVIE